jgi:hypothetical protein
LCQSITFYTKLKNSKLNSGFWGGIEDFFPGESAFCRHNGTKYGEKERSSREKDETFAQNTVL